jgi:hypothetical protein
MHYIKRVLEKVTAKYLSNFPVVGITGPRQSGKSTMLLKSLGQTYQYVTFDDYRMVDLFYSDPVRFMRIYSDKVIFDEVQKVPEIFSYIKLAVDADRRRSGKFIVTGSSQFHFMKRISESLAGRIGLLSLLPFQFSEVPTRLRSDSIFRGGYPELVTKKYYLAEQWYSSYVETYLNRDVREIIKIGDIRDFQKCLQLLASRVSNILNLSDLARDVGVTVPTIKSWLSVLEASYIIFLLPPYYKNLGKRIIKSPKIYFWDTGLISFLTGVSTSQLFEKGPMYGAIFENYVLSEIYKQELHRNSMSKLYYYRTNHGVEVDLIIDHNVTKKWIEVKVSETFKPDMIKHIEHLGRGNYKGYLLYRGKEVSFTKDIKIINYAEYLLS